MNSNELRGDIAMKKIHSFGVYALVGVACAALAGCASEPSAVEQNFGSSVRNAVALQTAAPETGAYGMEGPKGEVVLETFRKDVAKPEKVERDLIQIRLGK